MQGPADSTVLLNDEGNTTAGTDRGRGREIRLEDELAGKRDDTSAGQFPWDCLHAGDRSKVT